MKRVLAIGDLHCGHQVGLTHPDFDVKHNIPELEAVDAQRQAYWDYFSKVVNQIQPVDVLIVNGDAIDGKGPKSGGTELLTTDRNRQVEMAIAAIEFIGAQSIVMTYGTGYHTGQEEDWERMVADGVGAIKIGGHDFMDVNGVVFDYKHHVGSSVVPYGRHTAVSREHFWNIVWAEHDEYPKSDIILRSHVHYYDFCGGFGWLGMTLPALQGMGSKYGARICSGTVDFGVVHFDVYDNGSYEWFPHVLKVRQSGSNLITV